MAVRMHGAAEVLAAQAQAAASSQAGAGAGASAGGAEPAAAGAPAAGAAPAPTAAAPATGAVPASAAEEGGEREAVDDSCAIVAAGGAGGADGAAVYSESESLELIEGFLAEAQPLPPMDDWPFDVWSVPEACMPAAMFALLHGQGVLLPLRVPLDKLVRFLAAARDLYWRNPFHNAQHGLHVAQASDLLLRRTGADAALPDLERFALLLAAFCHDVDHPAVGNAFLDALEDDLALRYNSQAVLENHHCALTCELLRDAAGGTDVLAAFAPAERRRVRQVIITAILATDMSRHFGHVIPAVKQLTLPLAPLRDAASGAARPEVAVLKDRDRLHEIILHCADLSGQVLPWDISERWSQGIVAEFRAQAQLEVAAGLPITPHMHGLNTAADIAKLQGGFCDYVLAPLWRAMADVFPTLVDRVEVLEANSARFKAILAEEKEKEKEKEQSSLRGAP